MFIYSKCVFLGTVSFGAVRERVGDAWRTIPPCTYQTHQYRNKSRHCKAFFNLSLNTFPPSLLKNTRYCHRCDGSHLLHFLEIRLSVYKYSGWKKNTFVRIGVAEVVYKSSGGARKGGGSGHSCYLTECRYLRGPCRVNFAK